jgi:hypothetical protein
VLAIETDLSVQLARCVLQLCAVHVIAADVAKQFEAAQALLGEKRAQWRL